VRCPLSAVRRPPSADGRPRSQNSPFTLHHRFSPMSKDKEKDHKSPAEAKQPSFEGGGMNTGVALIGFILCFLAGAGLMWAYDTNKNRQAGGAAIVADGTSWSDEESPVPVSSKDPTWGNRAAPVTIAIFSD